MKNIFLVIFTLLVTSCVMKPTQMHLNKNVTTIGIHVSNNNDEGFKDKLYTRLGKNKVLKLSSNQLIVNVIQNEVVHTKYKKKIYVKNDIYTYKICYVDTHNFTVDLEYAKNSKIVAKELVKTTTVNDSCDSYILEDYKAYTIEKNMEKIIKILNQRSP